MSHPPPHNRAHMNAKLDGTPKRNVAPPAFGARRLAAFYWPPAPSHALLLAESQHLDTLRTRLDTLRHNKKIVLNFRRPAGAEGRSSSLFKFCSSLFNFVQDKKSFQKSGQPLKPRENRPGQNSNFDGGPEALLGCSLLNGTEV